MGAPDLIVNILRTVGINFPDPILQVIRSHLSSLLLSTLLLIFIFNRTPVRKKTVTLLVLGDIGRSPRMMYHAESFMKAGWEVWIIAYAGTEVSCALREGMALPAPGLKVSRESQRTGARRVNIRYIPETPGVTRCLPFLLAAPIKVVWQCVTLLYLLLRFPSDGGSEILMVQNPPSIPTLPLVQLTSLLRSSKLVIDWHNLGYSILAMKAGQESMVVAVAEWIERMFGRRAGVHVFVTEAMRDWVGREWRLEGQKVVLHDRPPDRFRRSTLREVHELFTNLKPNLSPPLVKLDNAEEDDSALPPPIETTLLTAKDADGTIAYRIDRPALIVSSTSWTADEDFSVLLAALDAYEVVARRRAFDLEKPLSEAEIEGREELLDTLPDLVVLISGKGPMRADFERQVRLRESSTAVPAAADTSTFHWTRVTVRCVWLETDDYPTFLGSADLGISLHQSSSGLDLPMKVVDMFGCEVPVLSRGFECVSELVKEGRNGRVFDTAEELANNLIDLLGEGFPARAPKLDALHAYFKRDRQETGRDGLVAAGKEEGGSWGSWSENWTRTLGPLLLGQTE